MLRKMSGPSFSMFECMSLNLHGDQGLMTVLKERSYRVEIILDASMCVIFYNSVDVYQSAVAAS